MAAFGPVAPAIWGIRRDGLEGGAILARLPHEKARPGKKILARSGRISAPSTGRRGGMSDELLGIARGCLEATLAMEPELESVLDRVVAGACFPRGEEGESRAPKKKTPPPGGHRTCQPLSLTNARHPAQKP